MSQHPFHPSLPQPTFHQQPMCSMHPIQYRSANTHLPQLTFQCTSPTRCAFHGNNQQPRRAMHAQDAWTDPLEEDIAQLCKQGSRSRCAPPACHAHTPCNLPWACKPRKASNKHEQSTRTIRADKTDSKSENKSWHAKQVDKNEVA